LYFSIRVLLRQLHINRKRFNTAAFVRQDIHRSYGQKYGIIWEYGNAMPHEAVSKVFLNADDAVRGNAWACERQCGNEENKIFFHLPIVISKTSCIFAVRKIANNGLCPVKDNNTRCASR